MIYLYCQEGQAFRRIKGGKGMVQDMTDKQFKIILEMVNMILDGCKTVEEAKEKVQKLIEDKGGQKEE